MLIGEYSYSIDLKGRLNFPAKLRDDLGEHFIVSKGLGDDCLVVYSMEEWALMEQKIKALPLSKGKGIQRHFFSSACDVVPDKQGRILIPQNLREYAKLEKEVMVIGVSNHCEIWSKSNWDVLCGEMDNEAIAQAMEELGF